jgi:hypothetical protein
MLPRTLHWSLDFTGAYEAIKPSFGNRKSHGEAPQPSGGFLPHRAIRSRPNVGCYLFTQPRLVIKLRNTFSRFRTNVGAITCRLSGGSSIIQDPSLKSAELIRIVLTTVEDPASRDG